MICRRQYKASSRPFHSGECSSVGCAITIDNAAARIGSGDEVEAHSFRNL
jgi:hypothetical protein